MALHGRKLHSSYAVFCLLLLGFDKLFDHEVGETAFFQNISRHLQEYSEDGGSTFLRNIGGHL
jgi:hypothetical protein